jgi:hypothetical protein
MSENLSRWDTVTMAELYYTQGEKQQALNIYRKLAEKEDAAPEIRSRWRVLEQECQTMVSSDNPYNEILSMVLVENPHSLAAALWQAEGLPLAYLTHTQCSADMETFLQEILYLTHYWQNRPTITCYAQDWQETMFRTSKWTALLYHLGQHCCMALLLEKQASVGKARVWLQIAGLRLLPLLSLG